jgi:hypothetical protein
MRGKLLLLVAFVAVFPASVVAQPKPTAAEKAVTTPKEFFGFDMGEDYCLANYKQMDGYWKKIEGQTDRMKVVSIGKTEEGRDQLMAIVTSPTNHKKLDRYREIARRLARAEGITAEDAKSLAEEGKAVVWLDGGLHASEVLGAQALIESVYRMVSANDAETLRILDDVVILFVHCNPDGHDLCADWYMREKDPKRRSLANLPRLYEKYAGHDNNRDSFAQNLAESKNMNRVMYREWFPQIVMDHHQTGPAGAVMFTPPCRDPFNYNLHPLVINGIERMSGAIVERSIAEDKPGVTVRTGARYSTWWNGGVSTTCMFHNMIGSFTETIGGPTPSRVPLVPDKLLPGSDYLAPITPQEWHFRQSVEYVDTCNRAILDYASRNRSRLLHNIWKMGRESIERGSQDTWTVTPKMVVAGGGKSGPSVGFGAVGGGALGSGPGAGGFGGRPQTDFAKFFRDPAKRDPRGYILPADQPDFLTATKFVNTLIGTGVTIHRAKAEFTANGKKYPAGSYVVKCAQAFRPHVLDMFEPQDHPDDFAAGSSTPTAPYDMAGWTLAFQMGVRFDRQLDPFDGPFEELCSEIPPPPAKVTGDDTVAGFVLDTRMNDSFRAVNRLLAAGEEVKRLQKPFKVGEATHPAGTFFVVRKEKTRKVLEKLATELGTPFVGIPTAPTNEAVALKPLRVGLWDQYGGSMPAGWTRMMLERFEFPFTVVYPPQLDREGLKEKYDVLVFVDGAIPGKSGGGGGGRRPGGADATANLPEEYRDMPGRVTADVTIPRLKQFLEEGGTVVTIGGSTALAEHLGLSLGNHLATKDTDGKEKPLGRDKFYVPGSLVRARVDPTSPLAWGMDEQVDMMFLSSPVFKLPAGDAAKEPKKVEDPKEVKVPMEVKEVKGMKRVAWYDGKTTLRSGWAWGQEHLDGGVAIAEADVGKGRLVLCGPQILFRGQPHGTLKFLFNALTGTK